MPPIKTLVLALFVLGSLGDPAEAAGTQWWAWNRAWWTPSVASWSSTPAPVSTTPSGVVGLYAVHRDGSLWTDVPPAITLYTIPGPASVPGAPVSGRASSLIPGLADSGWSTFGATWQSPSYEYDALINLGEGPYASEASLTEGGAKPWYLSPSVQKVFGGVPNAEQRADFTSTVLERTEQAFLRSGVTNIDLTSDPRDSAAHSLSVVSGTEYGPNSDAIGITNMGGDGFTFIDKLTYADSVDELQWAVAHNVAHELMHAFGVEHHDFGGKYLDSAITPWEVLVDPKTVFGPEATQELLASNFRERADQMVYGLGAQHVGHGPHCQCLAAMGISPSPVPEPASLVLWGIAGMIGAAVRLHRVRLRRAA